ncbi:MAG: hypothetical protein U5L11_09260 [Arhodomonas sp.]|nr:hypothetical protein [Arhodomonas sp.]
MIRFIDRLEEEGRLARLLVAVDDPLGRSGGGEVPRLVLGAFVRGEIHGRRIDEAVAVSPRWLREGDVLWVMDEEDRLAIREAARRAPWP